ncbi:asparaginase [Komagataeibacter sp. FXV2]|nr:asparaginase [Komagataeibacter sp. FXV2]
MPDAASLPFVTVISTGGTIARHSDNPCDTVDYAEIGRDLGAGHLLSALPDVVRARFRVREITFSQKDSSHMDMSQWADLARRISDVLRESPDMAGVVVTHGTTTLEEAAFFLDLVLHEERPVVLVGAQRPASAISADGPANLHAALLVAASAQARGQGVLVVSDNEIHAAGSVTKASTYRLDTFRSPDFGPLGVIDGDEVCFARKVTARRHIDGDVLDRITRDRPRVDICYSYSGGDGAAIAAFRAAGARGIVVASMLPGMCAPAESAALDAACAQGVAIVMSSQGSSGATLARQDLRQRGIMAAGRLRPRQARILLTLCLALDMPAARIQHLFDLP